MIDFAKIAESDDVSSYLYKYNDLYYLAIAYSDSILNSNDIKDQLALAYEYGNPTATTVDFLNENNVSICLTFNSTLF